MRALVTGFSLIELLTALAVVAILAVILIPVIGNVIERSHTVECASNLRQMGSAIGMYAAEHSGTLPINNSPYGDGFRWYLQLNPYLDRSYSSANGGWARPSIFICPSNDPDSYHNKYAIFYDVGYWCNLQVMPRAANSEGTSWTNGTRGPVPWEIVPANRILVADNPKLSGASKYQCYYRNIQEERTIRPYPASDDGDEYENARIHDGGVNALFTDLSVLNLKAEDVNRTGNEIPTGNYFGRP